MNSKPPEKSERILIFNVNWLGDVLFSTATIRNIRYHFPASFIACIIPSRCYPVLKGNPHLDEIIIYDEKDRHRSLIDKWRFVRLLKAKNFDKVFLLHRSFTRTLLCLLAGIPERIGYSTKKRDLLLTEKFKAPRIQDVHRIDYYLGLIETWGIKVEDRFSDFVTSDEDLRFADDFLSKSALKKDDFLVALNPGGNWLLKRWPKENWAILADKLAAELGAKIIITGSQHDVALAKEIRSLMRHQATSACGALNLKQFAALCQRLRLFITADSGPLHIANSVGIRKIIALFGPTHPEITGPYPQKNVVILQKNCGCEIPCYKLDCSDNRCMKALTVEDVLGAAKKNALI
jgi:lipopolysaccharide heptosyltransferase II